MKTQYYTATSLDGFLADQNNSLDWLLALPDPENGTYPDFIKDVGAIAMGSTTYEWVQAHGGPWPYTQPTWVFTTRELTRIENADLRFVRGDVRPVHEEMRAAADGKNIWIVGGGELAGQFLDHGLLDELIVTVAPVTLGGGAPLLPRRLAKPPLRLTSVQRFGETFVELRYEVRKG